MKNLSAALGLLGALAISQNASAQAAPLSVCDIADLPASNEIYTVRGRYFSDHHHFFQLRDDGCDRAIGLNLGSGVSDQAMWEKFKARIVYPLFDTRQNHVEVEVRATIEGLRARNPLGQEYSTTYLDVRELTDIVINGEVVK